jgi:MazG family protein
MTIPRLPRPENSPDHGAADGGSPTTDAAPRHRALGLRDGLPGLVDLMDRLLAPDGCPWDREQSLATLRPYLLEEAHEVLEAMDDASRHVGELGDLLFQIVFQAALREREGAFTMDDVVASIRDKMIERHPHVFGDEAGAALDAAEVARRWEAGKRARRERAPGDLGVPRSLPAMHRAARLQEKAAAVGFDWPDPQGAVDKLHEEIRELEQARHRSDASEISDELGDVLFVLVRLAGKLGIDADAALEGANAKFERRFGHVLRTLDAQGIAPESVGLAGLDALWDDAKRAERGG